MVENNIKNTINDLINEIKTTTENNLNNLEQIMEFKTEDQLREEISKVTELILDN